MGKDLWESPEYAAVAEHIRRLHEPALGRPHHVTDLVTTTDASRIVVTGSVYDELEGLPRTALYEVRDGALHALTSDGGSARSGRFAPDGSSLAFLSDRAKAESFQLYLEAWSDSACRTAVTRAAAVDVSFAPPTPRALPRHPLTTPPGARGCHDMLQFLAWS